jgi:hypothetical protein
MSTASPNTMSPPTTEPAIMPAFEVPDEEACDYNQTTLKAERTVGDASAEVVSSVSVATGVGVVLVNVGNGVVVEAGI